MSEYFFRLGMTEEMRRRIEDWRVENRYPDTGKIPSFADACRTLIDSGLGDGRESQNPVQNGGGDGEGE